MITIKHINTSGLRPTAIYEIKDDDQVVGEIQLRHTPGKSDNLPNGFESHVYYEIYPEFRGKGFAKEALKLLLEEARQIDLSEIIV